MDTYRIAQVAELVGVAPSALRYYEDIGLIAKPSRGTNGYRSYDDADLARLAFVTNAKNLGIPLDDIRDLVVAYDTEDCSTVAHYVVELVAARLAETRTRIADLTALAEQLNGVTERLAASPTAGACGVACPCATVSVEASSIACSLDDADLADRVHQWRAVVAFARTRTDVPGGTDMTFSPDPTIAADLAGLAVAEQACCPFFTFTMRISPDELRLEVRGPADTAPLVAALFAPS